jgi:hypothetical protein
LTAAAAQVLASTDAEMAEYAADLQIVQGSKPAASGYSVHLLPACAGTTTADYAKENWNWGDSR